MRGCHFICATCGLYLCHLCEDNVVETILSLNIDIGSGIKLTSPSLFRKCLYPMRCLASPLNPLFLKAHSKSCQLTVDKAGTEKSQWKQHRVSLAMLDMYTESHAKAVLWETHLMRPLPQNGQDDLPIIQHKSCLIAIVRKDAANNTPAWRVISIAHRLAGTVKSAWALAYLFR